MSIFGIAPSNFSHLAVTNLISRKISSPVSGHMILSLWKMMRSDCIVLNMCKFQWKNSSFLFSTIFTLTTTFRVLFSCLAGKESCSKLVEAFYLKSSDISQLKEIHTFIHTEDVIPLFQQDFVILSFFGNSGNFLFIFCSCFLTISKKYQLCHECRKDT